MKELATCQRQMKDVCAASSLCWSVVGMFAQVQPYRTQTYEWSSGMEEKSIYTFI